MERDRALMHNNGDKKNENDDDEDLPPPNKEQSKIADLITAEALATLQQYCQQQEVESRLSNMVCSIEKNLHKMQLQRPKSSLSLTCFFRILPNRKKKKYYSLSTQTKTVVNSLSLKICVL